MRSSDFNAKTQRPKDARNFLLFSFSPFLLFCFALCLCVSAVNTLAQTETPPAPLAPKSAKVPTVVEKKLLNGLTVAVAERHSSPLVTIQLLVRAGAAEESTDKAGLANLTANMLTKGTKTRSATKIAEDVEFLGGTIDSGANWNSSFISITVTSDKVQQALVILADVVLNPTFDQKELDLLKSQTLDGLTYNLKQPSFLANYVASTYTFGEHPIGGTPSSVQSITTQDVEIFHTKYFRAERSVLIFTGDTTLAAALSASGKLLSQLKNTPETSKPEVRAERIAEFISPAPKDVHRIAVIDLPQSGQAAVSYIKFLSEGRRSSAYFPATTANAVLGGGYSARLNEEIRIKRGLSYGAGSSIAWRYNVCNFSTRAQTKNPSAAEVAELTLEEVKKLANDSVPTDELVPRKSTLTGNFGTGLETTAGLARAVSDLYSFGMPTSELNNYVTSVNGVTDAQIRDFASKNLLGGDIIIAGDYSVFKDDLAKRFPGVKVEVIKAADLK